MGHSDAELIARTTHDPMAFAEVFDRHYTVIYRYAAGRVGVADGEEIAAQTFLVALEQTDRYDTSRADARPWLFGIATNLIRHHHRRRGRSARAHVRLRNRLAPQLSVMVEESPVDLRHDVRPVMDAISRLPAPERDALLLFAWADLSYAQIAETLQVPVGTVRSRLHRARTTLRAQLAPTVGGSS